MNLKGFRSPTGCYSKTLELNWKSFTNDLENIQIHVSLILHFEIMYESKKQSRGKLETVFFFSEEK